MSSALQAILLNFMSRFGCCDVPKPQNIRRLVVETARHEFLVKAVGATYAINSGLPSVHQRFWNEQSVEKLYSLYKSLIATTGEFIQMISEPEVMNSAEECMDISFSSLEVQSLRISSASCTLLLVAVSCYLKISQWFSMLLVGWAE